MLTENMDGTYTCSECMFVFGKTTVEESNFDDYHDQLHSIVMVQTKNLPERFRDISNGE